MDEERRPVDSPRFGSLVEKFRDKGYRDSYVGSHTRRFLARQMKKFRGDKSQSEFGDLIGRRQTVVSRLEDSNYGKWTLQTLFDVAAKLNIAVIVRFVDFPTFLKFTENLSDDASRPGPYDETLKQMDALLKPEEAELPSKSRAAEEKAAAFPLGPKLGDDFIGQDDTRVLPRLPVPYPQPSSAHEN